MTILFGYKVGLNFVKSFPFRFGKYKSGEYETQEAKPAVNPKHSSGGQGSLYIYKCLSDDKGRAPGSEGRNGRTDGTETGRQNFVSNDPSLENPQDKSETVESMKR